MQRYLKSAVLKYIHRKIILLTGPRQCGKTTLSKQLDFSYDYLNIDNKIDLMRTINMEWDRKKELLILDEFHKLNKWKRFIKGVYDTEGLEPKILIPGSTRLDVLKNVGDSLAGRYFQYRLHPIDINEACCKLNLSPLDAFNIITSCSGFPEPFLERDEAFYKIWSNTHIEIILQQDLIDLSFVRSIRSIKLLANLLHNRIGSGVNYSNLANDLQVSPGSIKKWLELLENVYMFFYVTPYHKNIARSLLKEPKAYSYDIASVEDKGAQLENLVALSILKRLHYLEDTQGSDIALHYCRTKDGREVDFLVQIDKKVYLIEVKTSDSQISKSFGYFAKYFKNPTCIQLVQNLAREYSTVEGYMVCNLIDWLAAIDDNLNA